MSREVLMTGASGFIGSALARELVRLGDRVTALVRDEDLPLGCSRIRGDLESFDDVRRAMLSRPWDVVYHLGAQALVGVGHMDPLTTLKSNVAGTWNVLEAARLSGRNPKVIVASSDKAYGEIDPMLLYTEEMSLSGRGIYDCSKSCADLIAQSYHEEYGLFVLIARLGNVYGPGDPEPTRIVPSVVDDLVNGRRPIIRSDGSPVRDYLYIDDAVRAYLALGECTAVVGNTAFNFSGEQPVPVLELVRIATDVALEKDELAIWAGYQRLGEHLGHRRAAPGSNFIFEQIPRSHWEPVILGERGNGEIPFQALDCTKAREQLGWAPKVSLEDGLRETLRAAWRTKNGID